MNEKIWSSDLFDALKNLIKINDFYLHNRATEEREAFSFIPPQRILHKTSNIAEKSFYKIFFISSTNNQNSQPQRDQ